jgi:hypothetical protein
MQVHRVDTVHDAVRLASNMKRTGQYDWFRGQVENWPLTSSFCRLARPDEEDAALQRAARFEHWVKGTPGLESIASNADAIIAVAQHYGIPTNFVDFTTDPATAGFFASERPPGDPTRDSCILCLNTQDLERFWRSMPSKYPRPEFIRLDVPNLWRLEAQSGTFLFCPYGNFEHIYDLDRIVFRYTGPVTTITPDDVYPKRKSQLEILLDQYFTTERMRQGNEEMAHNIAAGLLSVHDFTREERYDPDLLPGGPPPPAASWHPDVLARWLAAEPEHYWKARSAAPIYIELEVVSDGDDLIRENVNAQILKRLAAHGDIRAELLNWRVQVTGWPDGVKDRVGDALRKLWDGVRVLPYSNEDIALGMANCVVIACIARRSAARDPESKWLHVASECFGEAIEVEFGAHDASYSRGYASKAMLLKAVRDDIGTFLHSKWTPALVDDITGLLLALQAPERLFEFDRLARVFVHQLIPTQVLIRSGAVFFSPARLDAFGLP